MSTPDLIRLFHHRWSAPVLAELERQRGTRFVALARMLGVGRESLRRTLDSLIEQGLVERNEGYGHPLRPEYLLTGRGKDVARRCGELLALLDGSAELVLRKWSLPVLVVLQQPMRFSELRGSLPGITGRALALALKDLQQAGLVERRVDEQSYPPGVVDAVTAAGRKLQRPLN